MLSAKNDPYLDSLRALLRDNASRLISDIAINYDPTGTGFVDASLLAKTISKYLGFSADDIALLLANVRGDIFQPSPSGRKSLHGDRPVIKVQYRDMILMNKNTLSPHDLSSTPRFRIVSASSLSVSPESRKSPVVWNISAPAKGITSPPSRSSVAAATAAATHAATKAAASAAKAHQIWVDPTESITGSKMQMVQYQKDQARFHDATLQFELQCQSIEQLRTFVQGSLLPIVQIQAKELAHLRDHSSKEIQKHLMALQEAKLFSVSSMRNFSSMIREVEKQDIWFQSKKDSMLHGGMRMILNAVEKWSQMRMGRALSLWRRLVRAKQREEAGARIVTVFLTQKKGSFLSNILQRWKSLCKVRQWARMNEKELEATDARRRGAVTILKQSFLQWLRTHIAIAFRKWKKIMYDTRVEEARSKCLEMEGSLEKSNVYGRNEETRANEAEASVKTLLDKIDLLTKERDSERTRCEVMQKQLADLSHIEKERDEAQAVAAALMKGAEIEEEKLRKAEAGNMRLAELEALYTAERVKSRKLEDECAALNTDREYLLKMHADTRKELAEAQAVLSDAQHDFQTEAQKTMRSQGLLLLKTMRKWSQSMMWRGFSSWQLACGMSKQADKYEKIREREKNSCLRAMKKLSACIVFGWYKHKLERVWFKWIAHVKSQSILDLESSSNLLRSNILTANSEFDKSDKKSTGVISLIRRREARSKLLHVPLLRWRCAALLKCRESIIREANKRDIKNAIRRTMSSKKARFFARWQRYVSIAIIDKIAKKKNEELKITRTNLIIQRLRSKHLWHSFSAWKTKVKYALLEQEKEKAIARRNTTIANMFHSTLKSKIQHSLMCWRRYADDCILLKERVFLRNRQISSMYQGHMKAR